MTLEEKTRLTNDYIIKYRLTNDKQYKEKAYDIIKSDVENFVRKHFSSFRDYYEDIVQDITLKICELMEKGSSFEPNQDKYILYYLTDLKYQVYKKLFKYSYPFKFSNRDRTSLMKYINTKKSENPEISENDIIESYVKETFPNLDEDEFRSKVYYFNNLALQLTSTASLDKSIDDEGTPLSELISENEDFTKKVELSSIIEEYYKIIDEMKSKKMLSPLQYECLKMYFKEKLIEPDIADAKIAEKMGKTRQNFDRACNSAIAKFREYYNLKNEKF